MNNLPAEIWVMRSNKVGNCSLNMRICLTTANNEHSNLATLATSSHYLLSLKSLGLASLLAYLSRQTLAVSLFCGTCTVCCER